MTDSQDNNSENNAEENSYALSIIFYNLICILSSTFTLFFYTNIIKKYTCSIICAKNDLAIAKRLKIIYNKGNVLFAKIKEEDIWLKIRRL